MFCVGDDHNALVMVLLRNVVLRVWFTGDRSAFVLDDVPCW